MRIDAPLLAGDGQRLFWVVPIDDRMYVHACANYNRWVQHIEQDPAVRLKVEGRLYELDAQRVTSAEEFAGFAAAYEARYGTRPRNENVDEVYLFRLTARQPRVSADLPAEP